LKVLYRASRPVLKTVWWERRAATDQKIKSGVERLLESEIAKAQQQNIRGKERIAITNQKGLLNVDLRQILTEEVEVYDPRK